MTGRTKTRCIWGSIPLLSLTTVLFFFLVPAPVEGYYRCRLTQNLDTGLTYLLLRGGNAFTVSLDDSGEVSAKNLGPYEVAGNRVTIDTPEIRMRARIGWFSIKWNKEDFQAVLPGEPSYWNDNRRVWSSSAKSRMEEALAAKEQDREQGSPSPAGADWGRSR